MPTPSYSDPLLAVVSATRALLTGRVETFVTGFTVGTIVPDQTDRLNAPFVLVAIDGHSSVNRFASDERSAVRVSVWHKSPDQALALAITLRSLLVAFPGNSALRGLHPLSGPIPGTDPETGEPVATFTVSALIRPTTF